MERLARDFLHDVAVELLLRFLREENIRCLENVSDAFAPLVVAVGVVVHIGRAHQHGAGIVAPLDFRWNGAIGVHLRAIEDVVKIIHKDGLGHPVPRSLSPVGISGVVGVSRQTGSELKETAVGDAILVVVAVVRQINLPAKTAAAVSGIPAGGLLVEDGLGEGQPRGLVGWWVGELEFGSGHGGKSPEGLVVVALSNGQNISLLLPWVDRSWLEK